MANQGLMCVWQALSSNTPNPKGAASKTTLRTLTASFYHLPHTRGSEKEFDEFFQDTEDVTLEQYSAFVTDHLRDHSYAMCLLEDEIEQACWDLSKGTLQKQGYETSQTLKQLWQIFGRLCERGSLPPVMHVSELEWLVKKLNFDLPNSESSISTSKSRLLFSEVLEALNIKDLQASAKIGMMQKNIDEVHSWLVREVLMAGWMWKRSRKQANWTSWLKRWFVLSPGQLAYYNSSKLKVQKGSMDITRHTIIADLPDTRRFGWRLTGCFGLENRPFLQLEMSTMDDKDKGAWIAALTEVKGAVAAGSTPVKRVLSRRPKSGSKGNIFSDMTLDLPFMKPNAQAKILDGRDKSQKGKKCKDGLKKRTHISIKEPKHQRRLKKMTSIPEDQKQKIRAIFFSIDKDGNGKIDNEEFFLFLQKLGLNLEKREVDLIFKSIQEKQDGKITMEGFYIYFVKTILHVTSSTNAEGKLREAFLNADRDHTGSINFREFVEYVWERRRSVRISRVIKTFEEMDKDGDGEVQYNDFIDFLRRDRTLCHDICKENKSSDEETDEETEDDDDDDNNNSDSGDSDLVQQTKELQDVLYEEDAAVGEDPAAMMDYLRKRWVRFASFKRPGASGDIVMKGKHGIISDVLPGEYSLLDLAAFSDLPPLIPRHARLKNVVWESADLTDCASHGRVIFPEGFDGLIPIEIATTELLRYYGCSLANATTMTVSLMYRHAIQDFTYENQYIDEYVANPKKQAGAGIEKHEFSHLDMPLDDAGGYMVLGKLEEGEMHLTAFSVPTRHCLYLPGGTIHTNDYLRGTWRTMLSDEAPIDHCHIMKRSATAEGGLEKFIFSFK